MLTREAPDWGGAPPVVLFRPSASTGASGNAETSKYYHHSGHYTITAVILSLLVSGLLIFPLAVGYSFILLSLPVPVHPVLTLLYGLLSGVAAYFAVKRCKVRNTEIGALIGLVAGLGSVYLSWVVWIYGYLDYFKMIGLLGLVDFASSPVGLWHRVLGINATGSWDLWGYKPSGVVLWLVWCVEAALIAGLSGAFVFTLEAEVFCECCGTWCKDQFWVAKLRSCDLEDFKRALEAKDLAFLEALGAPPPGAERWLRLDLSRCQKCGMTNVVNAKVEARIANSEGRSSNSPSRPAPSASCRARSRWTRRCRVAVMV